MEKHTEAKEKIMTAVCEICHWPYAETDQEALDARCECCLVEQAVVTQLKALA